MEVPAKESIRTLKCPDRAGNLPSRVRQATMEIKPMMQAALRSA